MKLREQGIMLEELLCTSGTWNRESKALYQRNFYVQVVHGTEKARHYAKGTSMYKWYTELREQGIMLEELLCTSSTWN